MIKRSSKFAVQYFQIIDTNEPAAKKSRYYGISDNLSQEKKIPLTVDYKKNEKQVVKSCAI